MRLSTCGARRKARPGRPGKTYRKRVIMLNLLVMLVLQVYQCTSLNIIFCNVAPALSRVHAIKSGHRGSPYQLLNVLLDLLHRCDFLLSHVLLALLLQYANKLQIHFIALKPRSTLQVILTSITPSQCLVWTRYHCLKPIIV